MLFFMSKISKCLWITAVLSGLMGCGTSSSTSSDFTKKRYKVALTRSIDQNEWIAPQGVSEWLFFAADTFRQDSANYIEPQFYGEKQKCSASGSGAYSSEKKSSDKYPNFYEITLRYTGVKALQDGQNIKGDTVVDTATTTAEGTSTTADSTASAATPIISSLCRMSDRVIKVVVRSDGNLDLIDGNIVQRLNIIETIQ